MFTPKHIEAVVAGMNCVVKTIIKESYQKSILRQHLPGSLVLMNNEFDQIIFSLKSKDRIDYDKNRDRALDNAFYAFNYFHNDGTLDDGVTSSIMYPAFGGAVASHQLMISYASRDGSDRMCDEAIAIAVAVMADGFTLLLKTPSLRKRYLNPHLGQHNSYLREILDVLFPHERPGKSRGNSRIEVMLP